MAFNYNNRSNNIDIVAQILSDAKSDFLYIYDGKRLNRDQVLQVIEGLNQMGKALKCFVNRPKALGNIPGNLFYLDNIRDLETAEQFGKDNNSHILSFQIVHNPKKLS